MYSFFSIETLDWLWRVSLIQLITFIFFIFSFVNLSLSIDIKPIFLLIIVFYWSMHRPSIIPPVLIFFIGLLQDMILEYPIGLHSILYLTVYFLISRQRVFLMGQSYTNIWLFFSLTTFLFGVCEWLFFSIRYLTFFDISTVLLSVAVTVFLYPVVNFLMLFLNRLLNSVSPMDNYDGL